jgi:hypothetical protein
LYDFGGDWWHKITFQKPTKKDRDIFKGLPVCVEAFGTCPPENVGGPWGYSDFLTIIFNKKHPDHRELREWIGLSAREKYEFAVGLRLEFTDQVLDMENPDYFNIFDRPAESKYEVRQLDWFPTLHLKWSITENDNLLLAGSRRINRPPTKNMAPFLYRRHYEVYVVGDPALKPEYITNLELTYDKYIGNQNFH